MNWIKQATEKKIVIVDSQMSAAIENFSTNNFIHVENLNQTKG